MKIPETIQEIMLHTNLHLDMSIQELLTYPEHDNWLYESQNMKRAYTSSELVATAL